MREAAPKIMIAAWATILNLAAFSALSMTTATAAEAAAAAAAADVSVAVSANFSAPMKKLAASFTRETGHKLIISYGATGKLYAQIKNGAPFEILLSADQTHPEKLVQEQQGVEGTQFTYAVGRLALWSPNPKLVDQQGDVLRGNFKHLSLANPKLAPYGTAAREVLEKMNLWDRVQRRLVMGENIAQAHQFVATGNAELGFVAYAQVKNSEGSLWLVPQSMHSPLKQDAVLLKRGKTSAAARQFLDFLKSETARKMIKEAGYELQ